MLILSQIKSNPKNIFESAKLNKGHQVKNKAWEGV